MKPDDKEKRLKEYIRLLKRKQELWEIERQTPWTPIKEPYQDGWKLSWRLIDEAYRRHDGPRMAEALRLCISGVVTHDVKKISQIRKDRSYNTTRALFTTRRKSYNGDIVMWYNGPEISHIKPKLYDSLHPSLKKFFSREERTQVSRWGGATHTTIFYTLNIPKHYLEMKVKKRIITRIKALNPSIKKEVSEIERVIESDFYDFHVEGHRRYSFNLRATASYQRKHVKSAMRKVMKGEIDNPNEYSKFEKFKT